MWTWQWTFILHKTYEVSWLPEQLLAPQEQSLMGLGNYKNTRIITKHTSSSGTSITFSLHVSNQEHPGCGAEWWTCGCKASYTDTLSVTLGLQIYIYIYTHTHTHTQMSKVCLFYGLDDYRNMVHSIRKWNHRMPINIAENLTSNYKCIKPPTRTYFGHRESFIFICSPQYINHKAISYMFVSHFNARRNCSLYEWNLSHMHTVLCTMAFNVHKSRIFACPSDLQGLTSSIWNL